MKKFTLEEERLIEVLKTIARGSKKYDFVVGLPRHFDAKKMLKDLGFRGKYLN